MIEEWPTIVISFISLIISIVAIWNSVKYSKVTISINKVNEKCKYIIDLCNKFSFDDIMNEIRSYWKTVNGDQKKSIELLNFINKKLDLCVDSWKIYEVFFDDKHKEDMNKIFDNFYEVAFSASDGMRYYKKLSEIPDMQTWALDIIEELKKMRLLFHSQLNDYYDEIDNANNTGLRKIINKLK